MPFYQVFRKLEKLIRMQKHFNKTKPQNFPKRSFRVWCLCYELVINCFGANSNSKLKYFGLCLSTSRWINLKCLFYSPVSARDDNFASDLKNLLSSCSLCRTNDFGCFDCYSNWRCANIADIWADHHNSFYNGYCHR